MSYTITSSPNNLTIPFFVCNVLLMLVQKLLYLANLKINPDLQGIYFFIICSESAW